MNTRILEMTLSSTILAIVVPGCGSPFQNTSGLSQGGATKYTSVAASEGKATGTLKVDPRLRRSASGDTILYNFSGNAFPVGAVVFNAAGDIFGIASGKDQIYEFSNGTLTYIHKFGKNGDFPQAGLVTTDAGSHFFGTTFSTNGSAGNGVLFELTNTPSGYTYQVIHDFEGSDGALKLPGFRG
jgi:hypothetical protein